MENGYSTMELLLILKRRWLVIALIVILGLGAGAFVTFYVMTPQYKMSSEFIVNQSQPVSTESNSVTSESIRSNIELINTYNVIIKSPAVLDEVTSWLGLEMSAEELKDKISVSSAEESQVVEVTVVDASPEKAAEIADTTVLTFKDSIPELMNVDNVQILSEAGPAGEAVPVSPNIMLNLLIALAGSAAVGSGVAFILETSDTTLRKESDVIENLGVPFMGSVEVIVEEGEDSIPASNTVEMRGESIGS
ncbi:capsular polysaccharide biosynthesis protein, putative chain length regulator [Salimicrobium jeotgali]|nr:Wzz/FepE/Etk N-terminal domain-containing protein [Salimicrobium jeotgali]EKE31289.1 capsular polysaccharide biosynthesis protein, putative chain length regulator [Salimicrobium jeotgali]MBM7697101.1 capsular polysaccharide biosynthesis protein [Salimicrobium jeotgali]